MLFSVVTVTGFMTEML